MIISCKLATTHSIWALILWENKTKYKFAHICGATAVFMEIAHFPHRFIALINKKLEEQIGSFPFYCYGYISSCIIHMTLEFLISCFWQRTEALEHYAYL